MYFDATPMTATERAEYLDRTRATVALFWLLPIGALMFKVMVGLASFALGFDLRFEDLEGELGFFLALIALLGMAQVQMMLRRVIASLSDSSSPRQDT